MAGEKDLEEGVEFTMEMLTDRRILVQVSRTIKLVGKDNDYSKFLIGIEGTIPDNVKHKSALDTMFRELMLDSAIKEAALRTAHENPQMVDKLVGLLKDILAMSNSSTQKVSEPPAQGMYESEYSV